MNDQPVPFSPFTPGPPPVPMFEGGPVPAGKKPRKKRAAKAPKPARKPRAKKAGYTGIIGGAIPPGVPDPIKALTPRTRGKRKPRPTMIPIGILPALGGLQEAETSMLMSIIGNMQDVPKKSRAKIVAALGKVFA